MTTKQEFALRLARERRLKAVRDDRDVSQKDVAVAIGTSPENVTKWEKAVTIPRDETMRRLAEYFGVSEGWLRYGTGPRAAGMEGMHDTASGAPRMEQRPAQRPHVPQRKQGGRGRK